MISFKHPYFEVIRRRDFSTLILTVLVGQLASSFLVLSLITSVFKKTGSDFGVSGVILSLSMPALLLMAVSGLVADIVDRRKLIIGAFCLNSVWVLILLFVHHNPGFSIGLAFLYFAGNAFLLPAVFAASAQLVKKTQLAVANSIFLPVLVAGQTAGFFVAAVIQFFWGSFILLVLAEIALVICVFLSLMLPALEPRRINGASFLYTISDIWKFFVYIFRARAIWFYFLVFASAQGIVAFGATIAPGFFDHVIGLSIERSPLFIFPSAAVGILAGAFFVQKKKITESFMVALGMGAIGITTALLGIMVSLDLETRFLILPAFLFLALGGFGMIIAMIAARTVLQSRVAHAYQGSIFGANFVLSSLFVSITSPLSATMVALFGYWVVLSAAGIAFLLFSFMVSLMRKKWNF